MFLQRQVYKTVYVERKKGNRIPLLFIGTAKKETYKLKVTFDSRTTDE